MPITNNNISFSMRNDFYNFDKAGKGYKSETDSNNLIKPNEFVQFDNSVPTLEKAIQSHPLFIKLKAQYFNEKQDNSASFNEKQDNSASFNEKQDNSASFLEKSIQSHPLFIKLKAQYFNEKQDNSASFLEKSIQSHPLFIKLKAQYYNQNYGVEKSTCSNRMNSDNN